VETHLCKIETTKIKLLRYAFCWGGSVMFIANPYFLYGYMCRECSMRIHQPLSILLLRHDGLAKLNMERFMRQHSLMSGLSSACPLLRLSSLSTWRCCLSWCVKSYQGVQCKKLLGPLFWLLFSAGQRKVTRQRRNRM